MNLEQYSAIAEIIGVLAVILTLIYLSIQIRANTAAVKRESKHTALELANCFAVTLGSSGECSAVFGKGLSEFDTLQDHEKIQFYNLFSMLISMADAVYTDYQLGITTRDEFVRNFKTQAMFLKTPGGTAYWDAFGAHNKGLEKYINEHIFSDA
jgi:hypothetical protein